MKPKDEPPIELQNLEIDGTDQLDHPRPHVHPEKRTNKRLVMLLIAVIGLVLIGGGFAVYSLLLTSDPAPATTQTSNQTSATTTTQKVTAKTLVDEIQSELQSVANVTSKGSDGVVYNTFSAPGYKPTGYNFSVRPTVDYGFYATGGKEIIESDLKAIEKSLIDQGLTQTVIDVLGAYVAEFSSSEIICILEDQQVYNEPVTSTNYGVRLGCANKADYLANAALLRPYFIAYSSETKSDTSELLLGKLSLKASKTEGYSIATVPINGSEYGSPGFAALFYVTPDKTLRFFTGAQSTIPCSRFDTVDLKKAYLGETCDLENGVAQSTVKL